MTKRTYRFATMLVLAGFLGYLTGCGGGSGGSSSSTATPAPAPTPTPTPTGDLALSGVGGRTMHGHIGGTSTNFELRFTGGPTTGNYVHFENGVQLESGTYTYSKTSSTTGVINVSPDGGAVASTIQLTFTAAGSGTYNIVQFPETGTFTF